MMNAPNQTEPTEAMVEAEAGLQADLANTTTEVGDICDGCGAAYKSVFHVPNEVWSKIAPKPDSLGKHIEHQYGGLLCLNCADNAAWKAGITPVWEARESWDGLTDLSAKNAQKSERMEALEEAIAQELANQYGDKWDAKSFEETMHGETPEEMRAGYREIAKAIRALIDGDET